MEIKINAIIPNRNHHQWCEIFGYTSKGHPGVEITGLGARGRGVKEKLTYLSKRRRLQFPILHFALCVEGKGIEKCDTEFLELPLLIAFWAMAGLLPIRELDNCFASGKVGLGGEIHHLQLSPLLWQKLALYLKERKREVIYLGQEIPVFSDYIRVISADVLLEDAVGNFFHARDGENLPQLDNLISG